MSVIRCGKIDLCRRCPLYAAPFVPSEGPPDAAIMSVAEAPAWNEVREGRPLVGRAGQYWTGLLADAKVDRDDWYVANALKCQIPDSMKKTSKEVNRAIEICRKRLAVEIKRVKPKQIIAFGDIAIRSLLGKSGITRLRGTVTPSIIEGAPPVLSTFHPMYLVRGQERWRRVVVKDIEKAVRLSRGEAEELPEPVTYRYATSFPKVLRLFQYIRKPRKRRRMMFDSETTTFRVTLGKPMDKQTSYLEAQMFMLSFSAKATEAWVLPLFAERLDDFWTAEQLEHIEQELVSVFSDPNIEWWIQNLPFDLWFLHKRLGHRGLDVSTINARDLLVLSWLVDENSPKDLESLALVHTSMGNYKQRLAQKLAAMLQQKKADELAARIAAKKAEKAARKKEAQG